MQNAGITALGLDWRYLAFDVHPDHLREAIAGARRMNFLGLNLTVPHKLLAVDMVDALDESARKWGAVNTIRFEARDAAGQWQPLSHNFQTPFPAKSAPTASTLTPTPSSSLCAKTSTRLCLAREFSFWAPVALDASPP